MILVNIIAWVYNKEWKQLKTMTKSRITIRNGEHMDQRTKCLDKQNEKSRALSLPSTSKDIYYIFNHIKDILSGSSAVE